MSGTFNPNEPGIEATDDETLAKAHGLTEWNEARGQWTAPPQPSDSGQRDGWAKPGHEDYDPERVAATEGRTSVNAADLRDAGGGFSEGDNARQRELRDETPEQHARLASGLAEDEEPAATESDSAEPLAPDLGEQDSDNEQSDIDVTGVDEPADAEAGKATGTAGRKRK
jgi:hypothetical protein